VHGEEAIYVPAFPDIEITTGPPRGYRFPGKRAGPDANPSEFGNACFCLDSFSPISAYQALDGFVCARRWSPSGIELTDAGNYFVRPGLSRRQARSLAGLRFDEAATDSERP
jgi:hypothetical protein